MNTTERKQATTTLQDGLRADAKNIPQSLIDDEFYGVIVPNYDIDYGDESTASAVEAPAATIEKQSLRQRVSRKLGTFATATKDAWNAGGHTEVIRTGFRAATSRLESNKAKNEQSKSHINKTKAALAATALAGLTVAGAYAAHKSGIDHATLASAFNNVDTPTNVFETGVNEAVNSEIITGGMGDPNAEGIYNQLQGTYFVDEQPLRIQYPASAAPLTGAETFDQSIDKGSDALYNAIKDRLSSGYEVDVTAYSQGTVVQKDAIDRLIAENGGVLPEGVNATYLASPNLPTGLYNNSIFQAVEPVLNQLGANLDHTPLHEGAHVYARETDVVSNSADRPWTTALSQAVGYAAGDGHALTAADIADTSRQFTHTTPDGVTITSIRPEGTQTAALRAAEMNGFLVTQEADAFGQAIAPQGTVGLANPNINGDEVIRTGAALIDDSARRAGLANPNLSQAAHDWVTYTPEPVRQAVNDTINSVFNPQSAPVAPEVAQPYVAPVIEAPVYTPPAPVEAPVYAPPATEQVVATIDSASVAAQQAANTWAPGNQQLQNDIANVTNQVHGLANQFGLVR